MTDYKIGDKVKVVSWIPRLIEKFGGKEGEIIRINEKTIPFHIEVYFPEFGDKVYYGHTSFIFIAVSLELIKSKNYFYGI